MGQTTQILSSRLGSLQWIDGVVRELDVKVKDIERRVQVSGDLDGAEVCLAGSVIW